VHLYHMTSSCIIQYLVPGTGKWIDGLWPKLILEKLPQSPSTTNGGTEIDPTYSPFLSILYPAWIAIMESSTQPQQSNIMNKQQHFLLIARKDSISVAIDRNLLLSCPVSTIDISVPPHFQVLKNIFRPTGGPYPETLSFPKVLACFSHKKYCPQQQEHHQ